MMIIDLLLDQTLLYSGFVLILFLIAVLALVDRFRGKTIVVTVSFSLLTAGLAAAYMDILSRPKPVALMMEWQRPDVDEAEILGVKAIPNVGIYVLLSWDGLPYPRYFVYEWDEQMAEQIEKAKDGGNGNSGDSVMMFKPFENSLDRRQHPWAHRDPQIDMMPPKADSPPEVFEYQRPSQGA